MFERFTEKARHAVELALIEARDYKSEKIHPEHLLAGIALETDSIAGRVLAELAVTAEDVRLDLYADPVLDERLDRQREFAPETKKILELALREALSMGHTYIGTEHLLLAIDRARPASVTANRRIAARLFDPIDISEGADQSAVLATTMRMLMPRSTPSVVKEAWTLDIAPMRKRANLALQDAQTTVDELVALATDVLRLCAEVETMREVATSQDRRIAGMQKKLRVIRNSLDAML